MTWNRCWIWPAIRNWKSISTIIIDLEGGHRLNNYRRMQRQMSGQERGPRLSFRLKI